MEAKKGGAERLGEYVRRARIAMGSPPLREIAPKAGISHQQWGQIENGDGPKRPDEDLLRGLATALERPYEELWLVVYEPEIPEGLRVVPAVVRG